MKTVRYKRPKRFSLKKRVRILEGPSRKHFDTIDGVATGLNDNNLQLQEYKVHWNGCSPTLGTVPPLNQQFGEVIPNFLKIVATNNEDDIPVPPVGGQYDTTYSTFTPSALTVRTKSKIFVSRVNIQGRIYAPIPKTALSTVPVDPSQWSGQTYSPDPTLEMFCKACVWIVIVKDTRPSYVGPDGTMLIAADEFNNQFTPALVPLFKGPLEAQFLIQNEGLVTAINSLARFGLNGAFKSYMPTRYKIVAKRPIYLSLKKPYVDFNINLNLNSNVTYQKKGEAPDTQTRSVPGQPIKNNFHILMCSAYETNLDQLDVNNTNLDIHVTNLRSRVYFRDL